jgi:SRSO17 transposase
LVNTIGYYLTPTCVSDVELEEPSLAELARVIKAGACIEASFKRGKGEVGMDEYQVRTWHGWHHHMALSLMAVWFLIGETHRGRQVTPGGHRLKAGQFDVGHVR